MKLICTEDPSHKTFNATATVQELWVTDAKGEFLEAVKTGDVVHRPDSDDLWYCNECGADANSE